MMKKSLDEIISYRRSIRVFKAEFPPIEDIKKIIRAGPLAPYADAAVGDVKDIRKFFIIRKNSKTLQKNPSLMKIGTSFLKRLEMVKNQGVPGVGTAPYYIIIAERKGIPQVEQQSLAHCLQNMWLKSTELGLGFHLVSMTAEMIRNKEFCKILNISDQEYGINGCAIGYPKDDLNPNPQITADVNRFIEELD